MPLGMRNATPLKRAPPLLLSLPLLLLCRSLVLAVLMLAWGLMESSLAPKNSGGSLSASPNKTGKTIYCRVLATLLARTNNLYVRTLTHVGEHR